MKIGEHLIAWLAAIRAKRSLPAEMADGSGRDAALPAKVARQLADRGLIMRTPDGAGWRLTAEGLAIAARRA